MTTVQFPSSPPGRRAGDEGVYSHTPLDLHRIHPSASSQIRWLPLLFPTQYRQIKRFLLSLHCHPDSLDDLAQETFLRAWQSRQAFRSDKPESFDAHLRSIARNILHEARRDDHRRPQPAQLPDPNRLISPAPAVSTTSELAELLEKVKSELSAVQWQAIELTCLSGLTPRQAAKGICCTPATFRNRLSDARKKIRKSKKILSDDLP